MRIYLSISIYLNKLFSRFILLGAQYCPPALVLVGQLLCFVLLWLPLISHAQEKHMASEPFQALAPKRPLQSLYIQLHHAEAEQVVKIFEKKSAYENFLSSEGSVMVDKIANAIWITDVPDRIHLIENLLKKMDKPVHQVVLQAYIVNADQNFTKEIGVDFSKETASLEQNTSHTQSAFSPHFLFKKNQLNISMVKLGPQVSLEAALTALESQGRGRILSHPRLITSNGRTAYIGSGDEIPYQERTAHGNTNVAFKKAVLSLEVTPQLLPDNKIILDLTVHQDKVSALLVNGVPAIHMQEIRTQVRVNNKQTIVLGGIFEYVQGEQLAKIPILGSLPIIGALFQHKTHKRERRELLIFMTPTVIAY